MVRPHYVQHLLEDLDPAARRTARLNRRLHHAPLAVPLGLATRTLGAEPNLTTALVGLAEGRTPVVEDVPAAVLVDEAAPPAIANAVSVAEVLAAHGVEAPQPVPGTRRLRDPRPAIALLIGAVAARFERTDRAAETGSEVEPELVASRTPEPVRETVVRRARRSAARPRRGRSPRAEETQVWGDVPPAGDRGAGPPDRRLRHTRSSTR